jgi:hypothetical protein
MGATQSVRAHLERDRRQPSTVEVKRTSMTIPRRRRIPPSGRDIAVSRRFAITPVKVLGQ